MNAWRLVRRSAAILAVLIAGCDNSVGTGPDGGAPTAVADAYQTPQDVSLVVPAERGLLANDRGAGGAEAQLSTEPESGTVAVNADGAFLYTPRTAFVGVDTFSYVLAADGDTSTPALVTITVTALPGAPTAVDDQYTVAEDTALAVVTRATGVLANDTDPEGSTLTAAIVAQPANGSVLLSGDGSFRYTPTADFTGEDAFTYRASDGVASSQAATVRIAVTPVNDAPTASADTFEATEDTTLSVPAATGVLANDLDIDGDTLQAVLVGLPTRGTLVLGTDGSIEYQPNANQNGADSFSYRVDDGVLQSTTVNVTVNVAAVNDAPVAGADAVTVIRNHSIGFLVQASDIENDALTYEIVAQPTHGTATLDAASGGVVYQPASGYTGPDALTFRASDGAAFSQPAAIDIDVIPPPPPELDSMLPLKGPTGRGLQLWGRYFEATPGSVTIGGQAAAVLRWYDGYAVVQVPAGLAAGDHDVVLTTAQGSAPPLVFTVVPWIDAVSPRHGAASDVITVSGSSFGASAGALSVGGAAATVDDWTADVIAARVPSGLAPGRHAVVVTTASGAISNRFTFTVHGTDQWIGTVSPSARYWNASSWTGTELVVWGSNAGSPNDGFRYDPFTETWSAAQTSGAPAGLRAPAVWTGREMVMRSASGFARYEPHGDTWPAMATTAALNGRANYSMVWTGEEIIVWGGNVGTTNYATGARYNPTTNTWRSMATLNAPAARQQHTAVWTGEEMIVWGGQGTNVGVTGGRYDPVDDVWRSMSTAAAPSERIHHTAVWTGEEMIVFGGNSGMSSGGRYSPATNQWRSMPSSRWGRARHRATWTGEEMLVFSGCWSSSSGCAYDNRGEAFDPAANTWRTLAFGASAYEGEGHSAAWTGTQFLVWGGGTVFGTGATGAAYDPEADTWERMARVQGEVLSGSGQTVVWTGTELVVWGGYDLPPRDTGGRFDPSLGTWTATPVGPAGRHAHVAVWDGSGMIVYGGRLSASSTGATNTGARYTPGGAWTTTSTTNTPPTSYNAAAVWTGSRMVVWGGLNSSMNPINTGGRYDPVGNLWYGLSTTDAPPPRTGFSMVWTGTYVVVWGGSVSGGTPGSPTYAGGRYDPAGDVWLPVSTTGAPPHGSGHLAVWTGTEMVVWGGTSSTSGGAYDPTTDTWRAISTTNAPTATAPKGVYGAGRVFVLSNNAAPRIYDPVGDTWSAMSTAGAYPALPAHALWTGSAMLTFGSGGPYLYLP